MKLTNFVGSTVVGAAMSLAAVAASAEDIVVTHYGALFYGAPYAVALEKGYFKDEGIDVDGILASKGGGTSIRTLMASDTLYAEVALPAAIAAIQGGMPIKIVAGGTDGVSGFWVTRPDLKIDGPEDLKGKSIAYSGPKSVSQAIIIAMLHSYGLTADDVKMVAVSGNGGRLAALESGQVDIIGLSEPVYSQKAAEGMKFSPLPWLDAKLPLYTETVGVATEDMIKKEPKKILAVIKARAKGVDFIYAHPEEAAEIIAKQYRFDPATTREAIANSLKRNPTWWNVGQLKHAAMAVMAQFIGASGIIKTPVDWPSITDESILKQESAQQ